MYSFFWKNLIHSNLSTLPTLPSSSLIFSREKTKKNMEIKHGSNSLIKVTFGLLPQNSSFFIIIC